MANRFTVVGLGEALFDVFPEAQILGGAPLNVAVHAHQLAQVRAGRGVVVSRVGQDDLGARVAEELANRSMTSEFLQSDPDHPTGEVFVSVDANGQPSYDIVENSAWDWLQFDPDVEDLARRTDAVCFGSLAQHNAQSRNSIYRFLDTCRPAAVKMFDVNLRLDFHDAQIVRRSCELANVVKLNNEELPVVASYLGLSGDGDDAVISHMIKLYGLKHVVLTRGKLGTVLYSASAKHAGPPVSYPAAPNADAVGAGDACSAAVLVGLTLRLTGDRIVQLANHAGAFVASQPGATPKLPDDVLNMVK
jgi:fructokinase